MSSKVEETPTETVVDSIDWPEGVPPLSALYLYIAGACNLACKHCYISPKFLAHGNNGSGYDPSLYVKLEHVEKVVREAIPLGLREVKLTGGEPTLHPQFREILSFIHDAGSRAIIETNGLLVDDSLASHMRDTNTRFVSVSVDGAKAETHDFIRGVQGSYDGALNGIRALVKVGYSPQLICTLHRGNVAQMDEVVKLAASLGCGSVKFNILQRMGRGEQLAEDQGLEVPEVLDLYHHVENVLIPQYNKMTIMIDIPFAFRTLWSLTHCSLGRCAVLNILGMLPGGQLSLCGVGVVHSELVYGNIETDNLKDVWFYSPGLQLLREQIPNQLEGICAECVHREFCLGNCVAQTLHLSGRLNAPQAFCQRADELELFPQTRKIE